MLSVNDVARRVGRDPETIRRWIRSGRLKSQRIGTQHFVLEVDLDEMTELDTTALPTELTRMYDGSSMPAWEQLIRDGRRSH